MKITQDFLESGKAKSGYFNRFQLKLLGIYNYPPTQEQLDALIGATIDECAAADFLKLRNMTQCNIIDLGLGRPGEVDDFWSSKEAPARVNKRYNLAEDYQGVRDLDDEWNSMKF